MKSEADFAKLKPGENKRSPGAGKLPRAFTQHIPRGARVSPLKGGHCVLQ